MSQNSQSVNEKTHNKRAKERGPMSLRVPSSLRNEIEKEAKKKGSSLSQYIIKILQDREDTSQLEQQLQDTQKKVEEALAAKDKEVERIKKQHEHDLKSIREEMEKVVIARDKEMDRVQSQLEQAQKMLSQEQELHLNDQQLHLGTQKRAAYLESELNKVQLLIEENTQQEKNSWWKFWQK